MCFKIYIKDIKDRELLIHGAMLSSCSRQFKFECKGLAQKYMGGFVYKHKSSNIEVYKVPETSLVGLKF
jgi:hypothetical protein